MWLIIPAKEDDIEAIYEIESSSFLTPWSKSSLYEELVHPYSYLWVAKDVVSKEIVGFICFWIMWAEMHIVNIAVKPEFRRKGVGGLLLQKAISIAQKQGVETIRLEVRASNLEAISFYKKFKFSQIGKRRRYYLDIGEDAIIMGLKVKNS
jgi:ribosomal-protein-alanine N-acetyltransferase